MVERWDVFARLVVTLCNVTITPAQSVPPAASHVLPPPDVILEEEPTRPRRFVTSGTNPLGVAMGTSGAPTGDVVMHVAFSPDGKWLLAGWYLGRLDLWNTSTWTKVRTIQTHQGNVTALAVSGDGSLVATGGEDGKVKIWNITTGASLVKLEGFGSDPMHLSFSSDGKLIAVAVKGGLGQVRDVSSREVVKRMRANDLTFVQPGDILITAQANDLISWNLKTGEVARKLSDPEDVFSLLKVDWKKGNLATVGVREAGQTIWDIPSRKRRLKIESGHTGSFCADPNWGWIATASGGDLRLWSAESGTMLCGSSILLLGEVSGSADGRWLAAGVEDQIRVWSADSLLRACGGAAAP